MPFGRFPGFAGLSSGKSNMCMKMSMYCGGMILTGSNRSTRSKSYLIATSFITYPTWIELGWNQRLRAERLADWKSVTSWDSSAQLQEGGGRQHACHAHSLRFVGTIRGGGGDCFRRIITKFRNTENWKFAVIGIIKSERQREREKNGQRC
jgi:hypothetical protein